MIVYEQDVSLKNAFTNLSLQCHSFAISPLWLAGAQPMAFSKTTSHFTLRSLHTHNCQNSPSSATAYFILLCSFQLQNRPLQLLCLPLPLESILNSTDDHETWLCLGRNGVAVQRREGKLLCIG